MKNDLIEMNPIVQHVLFVIVCLGFIATGALCVISPEWVRKRYIKQFRMQSPLRWYEPTTYLRKPPPIMAFRVIGAMIILLGVMAFFA